MGSPDKPTRKAPEWLLDFKDDTYSQTGEDGIIQKILEVLPENDRWCVEFGAWDGVHLCNTRNLIEHAGYSAVLIEGSARKYEELRRNYSGNSKITPINAFVGFSQTDNLDQLLKDTPIPECFDFLSIDVDGNDYHIWKALSRHRPKLVCVEFNPTIPTEVSFVQEADPSVNQGSSLLALVELGKEKGYELVCVLPFNAFFVKSEYFQLFQIEDNSPATLRKSLDMVTYLFFGFDGRTFLRGYKKVPWHGIPLKESRIQQVPGMLQKYPSNYSPLERLLFQLYASPLKLIKRTILRLTRRP
jgi:hypothetical protein